MRGTPSNTRFWLYNLCMSAYQERETCVYRPQDSKINSDLSVPEPTYVRPVVHCTSPLGECAQYGSQLAAQGQGHCHLLYLLRSVKMGVKAGECISVRRH